VSNIKVYGADWCGMTTRTLEFLDDLGVEYDYIDIDHDTKGAEFVRSHAGGKERKPTVDIDGTVLVTPEDEELGQLLRDHNLVPAGG
jgi:glutaredoxin